MTTEDSNQSLEGGLQGMQDADHYDGAQNMTPMKFYVVGRGRYVPFALPPSDQYDLRYILPLSATDVYYGMQDSFGPNWPQFVNLLFDGNNVNVADPDAFRRFQERIWAPNVFAFLESYSDLVSEGPHTPQLTEGGNFCFDVKLCKLLPKRQTVDLDFNLDVNRTRAVQLLRLLRARLNVLPKSLVQMLMRGPPEGPFGPFPGIQNPVANYPENQADVPFAGATNDEFRWHPLFEDNQQYAVYARDIRGIPYAYIYVLVNNEFSEVFKNSPIGQAIDQNPDIYSDATDGIYQGQQIEALAGGHTTEATALQTTEASTIQTAAEPTVEPATDLEGGDMYALCKGPCKTNRYGTYEDLAKLQWTSKGRSAIGIDFSEWPIVIKAHHWGPEIPDLLRETQRQTFLVWVPPKDEGRSDGYFASNAPDYALMYPWTTHFDVMPLWDLEPLSDVPNDTISRTTWKLLKAMDENYDEDPTEYGFRGGYLMEVYFNT